MTWRRFSLIAVLVLALAIAAYCREPTVAPVAPEPTATLQVIVLPTLPATPTAQTAGPPVPHWTATPREWLLTTPTRTPVPPLVLPPTETPTPEPPTATPEPARSPVQKGELWTRPA